MGKVVKTVAAVSVIVISSAIATFLVGPFGTIAHALITTALIMAGNAGLKAVGLGLTVGAPKARLGPPAVFRQSISDSFIVYGKRRVGGLMVFFHAAEDSGDHFRYFVIACAGHRCQGVTKWFLNDEEVTVDGSNKVTSGNYANAAWLWFQRGLASETANATFVAECGGKWTTDHKGNGIAAIYAKFEMTEEVVQAGMPNITAEIEGRDEIFDYRDDTTGYTTNAALIFYDWMLLPREEGGFGAYADEIPDADYISAQANVSDEVVEAEPRYALNAVITTGAPPSEIRDVMIVNCAGSYTYSGGKHLMRVGYWVPVSESFSEDDFAGPIQVSPFLTGDQAANEVQGTYIEPTNGYQGAAFATQSIGAADIRQLDVDLAFTTSKHQAERIAAIMLKRAQCEKTVTCPLNIVGLRAKALDTIQLDTTRYGLSNYAFVVTNWGLSADFGVVLSLREENEDIYDAPAPVVSPSVPAVVPGSPINPTTDSDSVSFTPGGNISADTVQGAIEELDAEKQPLHANLTAFAGLSLVADRLPYANGTGTLALATFTAAGRALIDDADAAAQRTTLAAAGTGVANTFTAQQTIIITAAARETALKASASDASNDAFYIANFTATASRFQPAITGFVDSADNLSSLNFSGAVLAARDTAGDGGLGVVNFRAAIVDSATDPVNGSFSALTNRTLFSFRNQATTILNMSPTAVNLGSGIVLQVNGTQVLTSRRTGWSAATGTATRTAIATYTAASISNPPTQAEVQAIADALQAWSRRGKAVTDDIATHGLIGA